MRRLGIAFVVIIRSRRAEGGMRALLFLNPVSPFR